MPRVSRWELLPQRLSVIQEDFWSAITLLENKRQVREFLSVFLTPDERTMLAKRFQVIMMLSENYPYQDIRSTTHVSLGTISRLYARIQDDGSGSMSDVASKIIELKRSKLAGRGETKKTIAGDILTPVLQAGFKSAVGSLSTSRKRKTA